MKSSDERSPNKLQRPAPEIRIFSATFSLWSTSSTFSPRWAGHAGAEQAGRARADDDRIELHGREVQGSGGTEPGGGFDRRGNAVHHIAHHDHRRAAQLFAHDGFV